MFLNELNLLKNFQSLRRYLLFDWYMFKKMNITQLCALGIPLTLVTIANLAKFISETVFIIHYHAWRLWLRFKNRKRTQIERDESQQIFNDNANEQVSVLKFCRFITLHLGNFGQSAFDSFSAYFCFHVCNCLWLYWFFYNTPE